MGDLPKLHVSGAVSASTAPPVDGWHLTVSKYGAVSIMRVRGGVAFLWHDLEEGLREWAKSEARDD